MSRVKQIIYGVGFYKVGTTLYEGGRTYFNSFLDETPLKERLSVFRDAAEGEKWAIVTGSSEGIGAQYAIDLAKCGYNVRLVARNVANMEKVAE